MRRYARHMVLEEIGEEGQRRLQSARVVVVGLGALGGHIATHLARAGVGYIRLIDRDIVEEENLQRQVLYGEDDVRAGLPKAVAAARRLASINSSIKVDPQIADLSSSNAHTLLSDCEVVLDGTDNLETRFLINDFCIRYGVPWVFGAVLATSGLVAPIIPEKTPCLRCIFKQIPPPAVLPTCQTYGVLNTAPALVAALQTTLAYRIMLGKPINPKLLFVDIWKPAFFDVEIAKWRECPTCAKREFEFLKGGGGSRVFALCGRNAVQINPPSPVTLDLASLKARLERYAAVEDAGFFLRVHVEGCELFVFPDGRVMVKGTTDPKIARSLVSRHIGM